MPYSTALAEQEIEVRGAPPPIPFWIIPVALAAVFAVGVALKRAS